MSYNGETIKGVRRLSTLLLVLLLGISVFLTSCGTSNDSGSKDVETLEAIYEQSNWKFRQLSANIQVYDKGTIKISIKGQATERTPGGDEFAWIPVALLKNRPKYYALEGDKSPGADLTAYQIKDGLWSVVAFVPGTEEESGQEQNAIAVVNNSTDETDENLKVSSKQRTSKIDIDVLIISPDFATSLPLYLPIGQGLASVDTSVELLTKAKFIDPQVDPFVGEANDKSVDLTEFSPLLPDGKVKALTKLDPNVATLWDLSHVQYRSSLQIVYQWWTWLSSLLIFIGVTELYYSLHQRKRKKQEKFIRDYEQSIKDFKRFIEDFERATEAPAGYFGRATEYFERATGYFSVGYFGRATEYFGIATGYFGRATRELRENYERATRDFEFERATRDFERATRDFEGAMGFPRRTTRDFERAMGFPRRTMGFPRRTMEYFRIVTRDYINLWSYSFVARLIIYGIIILFIVTLFFPLVALSQEKNRTIEEPYKFCFEQLNSSTLCLEDFRLNIPSPKLKEDETTIKLNFLPINASKEKNFIVKFDKNINVDKIDKKPESIATPENPSHVIRIENLPISLLPAELTRKNPSFQDFSEVIRQENSNDVIIDPLNKAYEKYKEFLDESPDAKRAEITLLVKNTRINQETRLLQRIQIGSILDWIINRKIHLFPFDENSLKIPITIKDAQAVLSDFIFEYPANYSDIKLEKIEGIEAKIEYKSGNRSGLKKPPYPIIYSDINFIINPKLSRPDIPSFLILFWIIPVALFMGFILEIFSDLTTNNRIKIFYNTSVSTISTLFVGYVVWVHNNNPEIPYLFKSGIPTIVEPFAFAGAIIYLLTFAVCLLSNSKLKNWIRTVVGFLFFIAILSTFINISFVNSVLISIGILIIFTSIIGLIIDVVRFVRSGLPLSSPTYYWQLYTLLFLLGILLTISAAACGFSHLKSLEDIASSNDATLSIFFNLIKVTFVPFSDQIL